MAERMPRRGFLLVALLVGALVAAWRPVLAQTVRRGLSEATPVISTPLVMAEYPALGVFTPRNAQMRAAFPVQHRSPSWHRGTGRRSTRSHGPSFLVPASGSIPAIDSFVRQRVGSFVRTTRPWRSIGRAAVSPRAPPAIN